jgi:hypothetical protein
MKAILSKGIISLLIAPALLLAFTFKMDRVDLSGEWKLNESKSDLGPMQAFAARVIKINQKSDSIAISQTSPSPNGQDRTLSETWSYDGKETETTLFGNSKKKSTAKWSDDGKSLIISYILNLDFGGQAMEIKGTETWTISDDGKTLTIENNSSSSQGDLSTKAVYNKQ